MKVKQLKALLAKLDDEMEVVVQEYNGCQDIMRSITDVNVIKLNNTLKDVVDPNVMKRRSGQSIAKITALKY